MSPYNLMLSESADQVVDATHDFDDEKAVARKIDAALTTLQRAVAGS